MAKQNENTQELVFGKKNYLFLAGGFLLVIIGFILMSGGKPEDPSIYNPEVFNFRRMNVAPTVVILGYAVVMVGIFFRGESTTTEK